MLILTGTCAEVEGDEQIQESWYMLLLLLLLFNA